MWGHVQGPTQRPPGDATVMAMGTHAAQQDGTAREQHRRAQEGRARQAAAVADLRELSTYGVVAAFAVVVLTGALYQVDGLDRGDAVVLVLLQAAGLGGLFAMLAVRNAATHGDYVPDERPSAMSEARAALLRRPGVRVPGLALTSLGAVGAVTLFSAWVVGEPLETWGWVCLVVGFGGSVALRRLVELQLRRTPAAA